MPTCLPELMVKCRQDDLMRSVRPRRARRSRTDVRFALLDRDGDRNPARGRLIRFGRPHQKKRRRLTGQMSTATLPTIVCPATGPQYRLSHESVRLSPMTK